MKNNSMRKKCKEWKDNLKNYKKKQKSIQQDKKNLKNKIKI